VSPAVINRRALHQGDGGTRPPVVGDPDKLARFQPLRDRLGARMAPGSGWSIEREGDRDEVLRVDGVSIHFGGLKALDEVTLEARRGEVTGVIGPNGAGKTTLFNCISGLYYPDRGELTFQGAPLRGSAIARGRRGVGRTFQTPRLFTSLSILDNLLLGCAVAEEARHRYVFEPELSRLRPPERAERIARLVGFRGDLAAPAAGLAFGDLRVIEFARALCAAPTLLMLDEPASGLDTEQATDLVGLLRRLADVGLAILLIEHDMSVVMGVCDSITVLNFGTVLAKGTPEEVQRDEAVIEAYLGRSA
jgi:branched-chain amino acid transport system ATP-binding protein